VRAGSCFLGGSGAAFLEHAARAWGIGEVRARSPTLPAYPYYILRTPY
jgi:hypothetical protein